MERIHLMNVFVYLLLKLLVINIIVFIKVINKIIMPYGVNC